MEKILSLTDVSKEFSDVKVLDGVKLNVYKGKVMGLVGENGAGKSTICKIITGVYQRTDGEITWKDNKVSFKSIKESKKAGIAIMHQELQMCTDLKVVENLFLGSELRNRLGLYNWSEMRKKGSEALKTLGVDFGVDTLVETLTVGQQQMVEIARAILQNAELLILDEPTAALTDREVDALFRVIASLKEQGKSFVYISHRLPELPKICDDITVFRDGKYITEFSMKEYDEDKIIEAIVGRKIQDQYIRTASQTGKVKYVFKNYKSKILKDISFELKEGSVTGLFGLMGAGRTELVKTIIGEYSSYSGETFVNEKKLNLKGVHSAIKNKIFYCSEDRKSEGLLLEFSVKKNIAMASPKEVSISKHIPLYLESKEHAISYPYVKSLDIKTPTLEQKVANLSGGNQQKVALAKALMVKPDLLILDEPTRGIDVGAKRMIYGIIDHIKNTGVTVLVISSDLPELIGITNEIYVMADGFMKGRIDNSTQRVSQEEVMRMTLK